MKKSDIIIIITVEGFVFDYKEFEYAHKKIDALISSNRVPNCQSEFKNILALLYEVLSNGDNSKYFKMISPFRVEISSSSQIRGVSKEPEIVEQLRKQIEEFGVERPLLVVEPLVSHGKFELLNGNHRHAACLAFKTPQPDFKYPCIVIPNSYRAITQKGWKWLQIFLNHAETKVGNDENDYMKVLRQHIDENNIDINDNKQHEYLTDLLVEMSGKYSQRGAKSVITHLKNNINEENSDIDQKNAKEAVSQFVQKYRFNDQAKKQDGRLIYTGKIKGQDFNGCIEFVSMIGSSYDQKFVRDIRWSTKTKKQQIHVFSAQRTQGSVETVLKQRKEYFQKTMELYNILGDKAIWFDYVVIDCQIKDDVTGVSFDNKVYNIKAENINNYKIISKDQVVAAFKNKEVYKPDWILSEDNTQNHLKIAV